MYYYRIFTLGCKVNSYESQALREQLEARGYQPAHEGTRTDVVIINTCSVTSVSDQKSRQKIRSFIEQYKDAVIVAMGCYIQMASGFVQTIPGVDILVGTHKRDRIPDYIAQFQQEKKQIIDVEDYTRKEKYEALHISSYMDNTRAFLKIEDGCDNFCSYCIIPYARGGVRSRPKEEVLKEVTRLVNHGYQEIVLTGIHTGGYGQDLQNVTFAQLLQDILAHEPRLKRLRISSIEESEIHDDMLAILAHEPRIANHLHIPLQSGSASVLRRMNRKYDTEQFYQRLCAIRAIRSDIAITTDIIVGFPGETEEEFLETYQFAKKCAFADIHVFPFSSRSGTVASRMKEQIDPQTKKERVHRLLHLASELREAYQSQFENQEIAVLFEEYDPIRGINTGHTSNYLSVTIEKAESLHNQIRTVIYRKNGCILKE